MKFQINGGGWLIGQTLIPNSTIIDIADKADHELTPPERLAKGRIPPLDVCALDADAALVLWRAYPDHRDRLQRRLDPFNERTFQRLLGLNADALNQYWPQGRG